MKKAFTMLELVFVIVVAGILAAVIIPNTRTNPVQEAAIQLVSHIRYAQHLAMVDDQFDSSNANWYKERWQLIFQMSSTHTEGKYTYTIFSDKVSTSGTPHDGLPNLTNNEIAMDPANSEKFLSGGTPSLYTSDSRSNKKMNLGLSYGINSYTLGGGCSGVQIAFDNLGRPLFNKLDDYTSSYKAGELITSTCIVTLNHPNEDSVEIHIEPETGYAHIEQI